MISPDSLPEPAYFPRSSSEVAPLRADARPASSDSDLSVTLGKLWRRRSIILATAGGLTIVALLVLSVLTPLYTATSEVLIGVPNSNAGGTNATLDKMVVDRDTVESQGHVVHSRAVAARVVRRLALDHDPEFNAALRPAGLLTNFIKLFRSRPAHAPDSGNAQNLQFERVVSALLNATSVAPAERSHVLEIDVQSESAAKAARIADAFADLYIEQELILKAETTERANQWLSGELQRLRTQVDQDERAVEDYRRANGLYATNTETITTQQMGELNSQLVIAESAKAQADAQYGQAVAMLHHGKAPKSIPQVLASPIIQSLEEKKTEVEQQAAQLSTIYGPKHPMIRNVKAQIADIDAKINAQVSRIVASLKNEQIAAEARYNTLKAAFDRTQARVGLTNEQSIKLHELEREAGASSELFQSFLQGYKQTSAQQNFHQPDAWVISHAGIPGHPDFPPKLAILLAAIVGGLILGGLLSLLIEFYDRTFRTARDVEETTGLQTLALVPTIRTSRSVADHVLRDPASPFAEAVRKLHTRLALSHSGEPPRTIMLTSSIPDEGKSLISVSMARLLAYTGRRVILVDGDFRRPTLHTLLGQSAQPGLVDLLEGEATPDKAVYRDPASGLHAIFAGRVAAHGNCMPDFERMRALLNSLCRHYELVILDTPPVLAGSEALQYGRLVDSTVFVTRWRHTSRDIAADAIQQLHGAGANVDGVALAQVDPKQYKRYASVDLHYGYPRNGAVVARLA